MWAIILLSVSIAVLGQHCDYDKNDDDIYINPECNNAGICSKSGICYCCEQEEGNVCKRFTDSVIGTYRGNNCKEAKYWVAILFGYIIEGDGVTCAGNDLEPAYPDLLNETLPLLSDYYGKVVTLPCQVCSSSEPCILHDTDEVRSGIWVQFGTDLSTHYDMECGKDDPTNIPSNYVPDCDANRDFGIEAHLAVEQGLGKDSDFATTFAAITNSLKSRFGENTDTHITKIDFYDAAAWQERVIKTRWPSPMPTTTLAPTVSPVTPAPTTSPTTSPTTRFLLREMQCEPYSNKVNDLRYMGEAGSSCRGNINETEPGGQTCESPYIICLPEENTPAMKYNKTHRYTVEQCLLECSFDQRCLGVEFVADANSTVGNCNLIDDIPLKVVNGTSYEYIKDDALFKNHNLDSSETGGDALCFEKRDYCNPYFEAEKLNDVMLDCYCPNNRKGYYTKKVKRSVNNTRFCANDSSVDERIRKAQANRMFHLCENWCLFNTLKPEQESWYWDPWKVCWRETYSGRGVHRAYCDRVIRNPNSIELKFINHRTENFLSCDATRIPTASPVEDINTTYFLSETLESCDEACNSHNMTCAANQTARVFSSEMELTDAFAEAGFTCKSENVYMSQEWWFGWALPGLGYGKICANRLPTLTHLEDLDSDCNRKIGNGWQRLCACY